MLRNFIEHAPSAELKRQLTAYEGRITGFYRQLLGEHYTALESAALNLVDSATFSPIGPARAGSRVGFGIEYRITNTARFTYDNSGFSPNLELDCAPVFSLSEDQLQFSERTRALALPNYLGPFMNVFGKFACFSVQQTPTIVALMFVNDNMPDEIDAQRTLYFLDQGAGVRLEKMFWNSLGYEDKDCMEPARREGLQASGMGPDHISDSEIAEFLSGWHSKENFGRFAYKHSLSVGLMYDFAHGSGITKLSTADYREKHSVSSYS